MNTQSTTDELNIDSTSVWTEEEKGKLNETGFYPHWGDESDYRRECSYADVVYDEVSKSGSNMYKAYIHHKEWSDDDYEWVCTSEEFDNFESLISFLNNELL